MNNELMLGNNSQIIDKNAQILTIKEEIPDVKGTTPQNITVDLPSCYGKFYVGSSRTAKIVRSIPLICKNAVDFISDSIKEFILQLQYPYGFIENNIKLPYIHRDLFLEFLQVCCKPCGNNKSQRKSHVFLCFQIGTFFIAVIGFVDRVCFDSIKNALLTHSKHYSPNLFFDPVIL
ncbi:hypothetical protein RSJ42_15295 [Methanosarcina hadiensis]|uniref:hypothetical protein n=1 Tax=Methanosarcina hadiensis TaxID=3078083 RepID=UPI0039778C1A